MTPQTMPRIKPGSLVQIRREYRMNYRRPDSAVTGTVERLSPSGAVAQVRMDEVADSYVCVRHVELVRMSREPVVLAAAS